MADFSTPFDASGWMFAAGPVDLVEPTATTDCFGVVEHPLAEIAEALLAFPGVRLLRPADPSWKEWLADCRDGDARLEFELIPFYGGVWGDTRLRGRCTGGHVLAIWAHLLSRHRGIWLVARDSEVLDTPASFIQQFAH